MNYDVEEMRLEDELLTRQLAVNEFSEFVPYVRDTYSMQWFHRVIADKLQLLYERKIKKLMLFVPPQHGKSELSTRSFPAWVLGREPNTKIAITSYSATIAGRFNRDIKRRMQLPGYTNLFPETVLGDGRNGYLNNNDVVEVVGKQGFIYTVGVGGSLTSVSVDLGIIDDPIKDREAASSETIRENTWDWYTDVFETRMHNDSVQCLIQTRWHQQDLGGKLLERDGVHSDTNPDGWVVVSFPGLRTADENDYDPRLLGMALWPEKHSQHKLERIRETNKVTFNSLYQQDPKPAPEALVYPDWSYVEEFPANCEVVFYGLDFGYTNDPAAWIKIGRMGDRLYLDELFYQTGLTNPDIAQRMRGYPHSGETYGDSAEPKSVEELQRMKLRVLSSVKGPDSINAGISKLKEYKLFVTRRSVNLVRELNNYEWVMVGGKPTNTPIDAYNHALDAVRGAVYTKYFIPRNVRRHR